jgi:mono/diheme cytochrome c family protein
VRLAKFSILVVGLCAGFLLPGLPAQSEKKGDAAAGKDVFEGKCLDCHNPDSKEAKDGPGLQGVKDGKLPSGKAATRDNILDLVNKGRDAMPAFKEILSDQQKEDVVAYVLTL